MKREEWRPVEGYPNYEVSNRGRVKNIRTNTMLKLILGKPGYYQVNPSHNGRQYPQLVHRMVVEAFIGPIPSGYEIDHINGIKTDNRVENLEPVTISENRLRAYRNNLYKSTPGRPKVAVLLIETGEKFSSIHDAGRALGIQYQTIHANISGRLKHAGGLHFTTTNVE